LRDHFINELFALAKNDDRIVLIAGDVGFGVLTEFAETLPNQFVSAGVAEGNMTGMAAGMALDGRIPYTYSIANFPTLRAMEQIRNDVCYNQAPVNIVAVGAGYAYGALGASHHATEDIAMLRSLPGLDIYSPADTFEAVATARLTATSNRPGYIRLGRAGEKPIHSADVASLANPLQLRSGSDGILLVTGSIAHNALAAAKLVSDSGINIGVHSIPTIKPFPEEAVLALAMGGSPVFTLEEHSILGGLGSVTAELLSRFTNQVGPLTRFGLPDEFSHHVGDQEYLLTKQGLDPLSLSTKIFEKFSNQNA
jgi:transketolase